MARWIVVAVLASFAAVYALTGAFLAIPVFGLQLVYLWRRAPGWWLLAVQAAVVYTTTLAFGTSVGILGFLAGSLLLTRLWPLAPLVAASGALIAPADKVDMTISLVLIGLVIYGLTRLTQRVDEVRAARLGLAAAAVAEERLRIAAELNDGLGRGLAEITRGATAALSGDRERLGEVVAAARRSLADARAAAAGFRAMSLGPEITTARAMLAAAGVEVTVHVAHAEPLGPAGSLLANILREAVTDVIRRGAATTCAIGTSQSGAEVTLTVTDDGVLSAGEESLGDLPGQVEAAGGTLTSTLSDQGLHTITATLPALREVARVPQEHVLSVALVAAVVVGFSIKALLGVPPELLPPAIGLLTLIGVLQLSSIKGRHPWRLVLMAVLTFAPIPLFGRTWLGTAGFLAGPILLALPASAAWPAVAAFMGVTAYAGAMLGLPLAVTVNYTVSTLVTGLVMYGLLKLARIVNELDAARDELARAAVVEERLRAARDLHDLLGHSLAAIMLKVELARRLDPDRARAELEDVLEMAAGAEADLRAVSGEHRELSLTAEAESARSVLGAAGIKVAVSLSHEDLSPEAETVLATVLREAVTNVLRHSTARTCTITTEPGVRLRVSNDGATRSAGRHGSSGIGNLTTRVAALNGTLATSYADGLFTLEAVVPQARNAATVRVNQAGSSSQGK
ncbi:histidine kinase [Nonomuraea sp. NPDC050556]|uniref:sensor histidine kinase n=1 Tax=Nonomuraea sp. NPDC050556 TaxID=3364369 RepID=UPI00378D0B13